MNNINSFFFFSFSFPLFPLHSTKYVLLHFLLHVGYFNETQNFIFIIYLIMIKTRYN